MMAGANIQGTFASGSSGFGGLFSDSCMVHSSTTKLKLTLKGLDGSNTVKTQKRTSPGAQFVDQTTYNSDQTSVIVTVASGEEWRVAQVTQQANRDIQFKLSVEDKDG